MLKIYFAVLSVYFVCSQSQAEVAALFTPMKAVLVIQGQDDDAAQLYAAMNATEVDSGSSYKKFLSFNQTSGLPLFDLACSIGKEVDGHSSCTMNVYKSAYSQLDRVSKAVHFKAKDEMAQSIAVDFIMADSTGKFFESKNKRMSIYFLNLGSPDQIFSISFQ